VFYVKYILIVAYAALVLSATSQQYFSLTTNQPAVLFSQNKPASDISHQPNEQALARIGSS
jgi:hypothetical protein